MAARLASVFLIAALRASAAAGAFQPADMAAWRTVSDPRISPDGQWLAYIEASNGRAALQLRSLDGKPPLAVSTGGGNDRSPRWSFDSLHLAWLSEHAGARSGSAEPTVRITVRQMDTGAETVIANLPVVPLSIAPAPEGDALAFTARVPSANPGPAWLPPDLLPRLVRPAAHIQVFVLPTPAGVPRRLSAGDFDYPGEPAWMPDGQTVVAARAGGQIYAFRLSGEEKALSDHPGRNECPLPSPDGAKIAWLATDPQPAGYAVRQLWVMNADGSRVKALGGSLDRDVTSPQWSSDGRTIYFLADDRGATHAYAARNDGTIRQLPGETQRMAGFSLADNGTAVTVRSTTMAADEIVAFPTDRAAQIRVLASPDRDLLAGRLAGAVEEISYPSEGQTIQAWLTRPPAFQPAQKHPLLVDLRDDPRSMCGGEFNLRAQIFAARGFVVLCVNARGTAGFGEEFGNLLPTRYPDGAAEDVMRGVDAALAKGSIDGRRMYVSGGAVAAWLIGHTGRFAGAILRHPVVDWTMDAVLAPERHTAGWMGALPWENPDQYVRHSPIYSAGAFQTPVLAIEEGDDPQSAALVYALQSRRIESTVLRFSKPPLPADRIAELEAELAWLERPAAAASLGAR